MKTGDCAPQRKAVLSTQKEQVTIQREDAVARSALGARSLYADPNLPFPQTQRQSLVSQIGQTEGNRHLQRMILVQRWDSPEHVNLGDAAGGASAGLIELECHNRDLPQRQQPTDTWPPMWQELIGNATSTQRRAITQGLTYGEVVALSGDFYADFQSLNRAPLREIFDLIPLIRGKASTEQLQQATGGRYLALAQQNESHFSNVRPGHRNMDVWANMHSEAIQAARQGNQKLAWGMNAAADHFLTDAFSGGHIRTQRASLMGSAEGNVKSKILHDLDNQHGVEVTNRRGDEPWIAYGDDMLADPRNERNRSLALEAVRLSKQDIADALAQGESYPEPGPTTEFSAELLVPMPVNPNQDRWSSGDYAATSGQVAANEGPGMVASIFTDDDQIRQWVATQPAEAIGRQPVNEKIRMINTLLDGWVSDEDLSAIRRICRSSPGDMSTIRTAIAPRIPDLTDIGQRTQLRIILGTV